MSKTTTNINVDGQYTFTNPSTIILSLLPEQYFDLIKKIEHEIEPLFLNESKSQVSYSKQTYPLEIKTVNDRKQRFFIEFEDLVHSLRCKINFGKYTLKADISNRNCKDIFLNKNGNARFIIGTTLNNIIKHYVIEGIIHINIK